MTRIAAAMALVLTLVACSSEAPRARPGRPPSVRLIGENLVITPGAGAAARIGFSPAGTSTDLIVSFRPDTARVSVCPLTAIDERLTSLTGCRQDIGSGVREPIASEGLRAVAIVLSGTQEVAADVLLEFDEAARAVSILLPVLRAPPGVSECADNGCNPFFEVTPTRNGGFDARARWTGGEATLVLLQGSVLGRSLTATGVSYREPARVDGASPLQIAAEMSAPGEYALALRARQGFAALTDVLIDARWP